ncbi:unnamed protein product, partial [Ixodes pacificus]
AQKEEALSEAQLDARIARREAKRSEEGEAALKGRLGEASQELEALRKAEGDLKTRVAQLQAALQREERQAATAKLGYETAKNLEAKCSTTADECRDLTIKCKVIGPCFVWCASKSFPNLSMCFVASIEFCVF